MSCEWDDKIFSVSDAGFEELALEIFRFQYQQNTVYREYVQALKVKPQDVSSLNKIPFLPVSFFKTHEIKSGSFSPAEIFESSATTGAVRSRHFVKDIELYKKSFMHPFSKNYGSIKDWCIIGLLPSYLERTTSSLVYMVIELITLSGHQQSGFYLDEFERLNKILTVLEVKKQKTLLIGVTFALLDFAEKFPAALPTTSIMETGGMKGRRQEMTRAEVHSILQTAVSKNEIHSEYGMTELLSQAYSKGNGIFNCPPWMKILVREEDDPFKISTTGKGTLNIIDLANVYSCSFIATDDIGSIHFNGSFEVLGRIDGSDLRGCSLLTL